MFQEKYKFKIKSKYLQCETIVGVVIPKKIEKFMLLLHGYDGSFETLDENLPLAEYARENNMLIVVPNMESSYYLSKCNYQVKEFLCLELLPFLFCEFELEEKISVYIAGISMGGYGSLLVGAAFPEMFKRIISISGAFIAHDVVIGNPEVVGSAENMQVIRYFSDIFAPFDTLENDKFRNPIAAIIECHANGVPKLIITCGIRDLLYERNLTAIQKFAGCGIEYDWFPIEEGAHDYKCFDVGLRYAFQKLEE